MTSIIVCSFSSGLDDLTRREQGDVNKVLKVLKATGRYSVFEAMANETIARMMSRLHHKGYRGYGKLIEKTGGEYPWTTVRLTEGGERLLADAAAATQEKT